MQSDPLERAAELLREDERVGIPLDELASRLATAPDLLAGRLRTDPRFALHEWPALPGLVPLRAGDRSRYERALEATGLSTRPLVLLAFRASAERSAAAVPDRRRRSDPTIPTGPEWPVDGDSLLTLMSRTVRQLAGRTSTPAQYGLARALSSALALSEALGPSDATGDR